MGANVGGTTTASADTVAVAVAVSTGDRSPLEAAPDQSAEEGKGVPPHLHSSRPAKKADSTKDARLQGGAPLPNIWGGCVRIRQFQFDSCG